MCDCIKYKDFFAADEINHIQLLKEELSLNETARFGTPEQEKEIVSLYTDTNNPLNAAQIAKQFNVSAGTINSILVRNGVTIRDRKITPELKKQIIDLYTSGVPILDIIKTLKTSYTTVKNIIDNVIQN